MKFKKNYTKYWEENILNPIDSMSIPNETICDEFIKKYVEKNKKILDLGCSFGRMNEMLYKYSNNIYGVDPDSYALSMASNLNYVELKV